MSETIQNIHAWDRKIFVVQGWLGKCEGLDCGLYASKSDALLVANRGDGWLVAMDRRLSIASISDFDLRAKPLEFQQVKVTALVSDYCRSWVNGCTDRAPELIPFSIQPILSQPKGN